MRETMTKLQSTKGITLIALVITIIVLLILAGIAISMLSGENGILKKAAEAKEKSELAQQEEEEQLKDLEELIKNNGKVTEEGFNETKKVNMPKLTQDDASDETAKGMIPIKFNGTNWVVCSEDDPEWYDYSSEKMQWANVMLSDGTYKVGEVATGTVVADTELGSMFVWVPRYAYSIEQYKTAKEGTTDADNGTTQNITKVDFLKGTTNVGVSGKTYNTDYDVEKTEQGKATEMIVHPAFSFGVANLSGIWVAKFEASMAEENTNISTNNDTDAKTVKILPNVETWRYIQEGNIFKVCLNMKDKEIYQLPENVDTHQMKNTEWGAVAYLAASQYGVVPARNTAGGSYNDNGTTKYHTYSGGGEEKGSYKTNVSQSTTGNVYGIYDMNGGAQEYVAAYWKNGYSGITNYGGSDIFENNEVKTEYSIYFDEYEVSEDEKNKGLTAYSTKSKEGNGMMAKMAYDRAQLLKSRKGDAMYEVIDTFSYYGRYSKEYTSGSTTYEPYNYLNWFIATYNTDGTVNQLGDTIVSYGKSYYGGDYVLLGSYIHPFLLRGVSIVGGTNAGVFASGVGYGLSSDLYSFRPVVVL